MSRHRQRTDWVRWWILRIYGSAMLAAALGIAIGHALLAR